MSRPTCNEEQISQTWTKSLLFFLQKKKPVTLLSSQTPGQTELIHSFSYMDKTPLKTDIRHVSAWRKPTLHEQRATTQKDRFVTFVVS